MIWKNTFLGLRYSGFQHIALFIMIITNRKGHSWPKNQKRCCHNTGSPPPAGSKNEVFNCLSVNSIVSAPANTGRDNSNKKEVTKIDHTNRGVSFQDIPSVLMLKIVVMKLIAPSIDDKPLRWRLKIARSTDPPLWYCTDERGGYTVHPVPAPSSIKTDRTNNKIEGGNNQKLMLFKRGKAISIAPIIRGNR